MRIAREVALAGALLAAAQHATAGPAVARTTRAPADARGPSRAQEAAPAGARDARAEAALRRERWRELLELDLPRELAAEAKPLLERGALAGDGASLALAARALALTGEEERALALLEASRPAEGAAAVDLARARLLLERDEIERALAVLFVREDGKTRLRHEDEPEGWLLAGRALVRRGDPATAEKLLARFVAQAPHDIEAPAAWHMLAQAAIARGDAAAAERARAEAARSGQWQAFYRTRRQQVRANPREPLPRLGLAQLWLAAGEPARALAIVREIEALDPKFCRALALAGAAHRALGENEAARASLARALACDPGLLEARWERALLALSESKDAEARADLEAIVASPAGGEPKHLRAHLELAKLLRRAGEEEAAKQREARYRELGGKEL